MPLIFLSENNTLSRKVLKFPFPQKAVSLFEIPLKKMRKKATSNFRDRLYNTDALFLSSPSLKHLLPERNSDISSFFNSFIINILTTVLKDKGLSNNRLVIINPEFSLTLSAINVFPDIALSGDGALSVSNRIYEATGASLPIVSGSSYEDTVLCTDDTLSYPCKFAAGIYINEGENSLSGSSFKFYPKNEYSSITSLIGRPLSLEEASLLSEYDKKTTFNIVF